MQEVIYGLDRNKPCTIFRQLQTRRNLLHLFINNISSSMKKNVSMMVFLEGGLGETILRPPKNGFPQITHHDLNFHAKSGADGCNPGGFAV